MYIGLDLGTSSLKGILTDRQGNLIASASREYPVEYPHPGWSQQDPAHWVRAMEEVLGELRSKADKIDALSVAGQMHGLVALDGEGKVIRPCILWNDGRTAPQVAELNETVTKEGIAKYTGNAAFAGFTAPKVMWLRENEPESYARIRKIMLPKDYLVYVLTGIYSAEYSDGAGTLLMDVEHRCWSEEMCRAAGVDMSWLPELRESWETVGTALPQWGLGSCLVAAGAGDNAGAAVGTGAVNGGDCTVSLGTSGTVFISTDKFAQAGDGSALHSFCHAEGRWHYLGCILSAASANKWWLEDILGTKDYDGAVKGAEPGRTGVFFLPYLMGERSPHNDTSARGAFIGMTPATTRQEMSLAVLEGVTFALRDCLEVARGLGVRLDSVTLCGGGARSRLWRQLCADIFRTRVRVPLVEQGPGYGAAILAMVTAGEYPTVEAACAAICRSELVAEPDEAMAARYDALYARFRQLYPALKGIMSVD